MESKIVFFFVFAIFATVNVGCGDKFAENFRDKHIIPYVPVYTKIDMGIGGEGNNWIGQPRYYNVSSEGKSLGYAGHGIIIYTGDNTEYECWDATCTNCQDLTSYFTKKDLEGEIATCPVCSSRFSLRYGTPFNGELVIYPLKQYLITKSTNKLIISY